MPAKRREEISLGGWCLILIQLMVSINCLALRLELSEIGHKRATQLQHPVSANNLEQDPVTTTQLASCDLLFSANDNIAAYCQCRDADPDMSISTLGLEDSSHSQAGGSTGLLRISQLNCYPQNFTQIIEDLTSFSQTNFSAQIQVDYLSVNTNFTQENPLPELQLKASKKKHGRLLVDHISLQLTYLAATNKNDHEKTIDSSAKSRTIEGQMIDFVHLINETHLQFLSIFLGDNSGGGVGGFGYNSNNKFEELNSGSGNGRRWFGEPRGGIKFSRLLAILTGLSRLELSLGQRGGNELLLESGTFKEQTRLRWLNLASNSQVMFESNIVKRSPFTYCPNLEYLSLESCNLKSFPLYSLFTIPLQTIGTSTTASAKSTTNNLDARIRYYGLPNLSSLNLAANRLTSLEEDLFTKISENDELGSRPFHVACYNGVHDNNNGSNNFILPALTQLDLSHNRLCDITFKAGQYILCSMPNLNQLYLQHNKIIHLNLNSLLNHPVEMSYSFQVSNNEINRFRPNTTLLGYSSASSQLEHIDLSYNQLNMITAIEWYGNTTNSQTRIKSINLSHNQLQHPIVLLDPKLINRLIFKESFDPIRMKAEILGLDHLESILALDSMEATSKSICDFLSPVSNRFPANIDLLNELLLTNNKLTHIDSNYFLSKQCKDIQTLRLSKNRIESLAHDALFELHNLEQLDLSNNLIIYLKEETFFKNTKLRILDVSSNRISSIKKNSFSHLIELESLSLSDNQLFSLQGELFSHNNRLEIIDLSNNKLSNLDDSLFYHSKYLRLLNLRGNLLKKFSHLAFELRADSINVFKDVGITTNTNIAPPTSFKLQAFNHKRFKTESLKHQKLSRKRNNRQITEGANVLILADNEIDYFQFERCFQFSQHVQLLWLNNNRLKELYDASFRCFRSIQRLYLSSNRIRFIGDYTFHHLIQLEYLDLSKNMISQVQANSFKFPNALSHLDLSANQMIDFKLMNSFPVTNGSMEMMHIELINLSENPDLTLDIGDFISFITRVNLHQVEIGKIGRLIKSDKQETIIPMRNRHHFQTLNLSNNNHIGDSLLTNLANTTVLIEAIDMSYSGLSFKLINFLREKLRNELIELNISGNHYGNNQLTLLFDSFETRYQLKILNASDNLVEIWPFNAKMAVKLHKLRSIDLSRNKLRHFIKDEADNYVFPELEVLNLSSNALVSLADNMKHRMISLKSLMPRIRHLDLSYNRITWIPLQFLDDLQEFTWLKLDNNQLESISPIYTSQRMVLDLSFNQKLRAIVDGLEFQFQPDMADGKDLILFDDRESRNVHVKCQTIDDYIETQTGHDVHPKTTNDLGFTTFLQWNSMNDDERVDDDSCKNLVQSIDSIILDITSGYVTLNSIRPIGSKFIHLSLRRNGLDQIETSDKNRNIVLLDLSDNKIHGLPPTMCNDLIELRSLDLSNNELSAIPYETIQSCLKLNYLVMANNRITSLANMRLGRKDVSALLVLRLNNNLLQDLHQVDWEFFSSLRFLDIRFNQFKSDSFIPAPRQVYLLTTVPFMEHFYRNQSLIKPHISISDTSMLIESQNTSRMDAELSDHSIRIYDVGYNLTENKSIAYYPESSRLYIKFCTLNITHGTMKVCLKKKLDRSNEINCFLMRAPTNIPSCLTYLHEPSSVNNFNSTVTNSSLSRPNREHGLDLEADVDPILNFIDSLKSNWLKLKDLDINHYLASIINVRNDSVYTVIDGKYRIYTLTIVKFLIVSGSMCIVALLIAMFALLTCRSTNQDQFSPKSNSEITNVLNTDSEATESSITNNSRSNDLTSQTHKSLSPPAICSSARSKSTSDNDETQKNTIMERKTIHQLDANMLMHQNQPCSTPSSSLAPSSVETAETLQAIDSIKSGTPIQHFGTGSVKCSVDQYAENVNNTSNLHPHYQVATVMRMVKSNSANQFDSSNRNSTGLQNQTYGTLSNRHPNYPKLKSKLRAIYENQQQKHQIYPATSVQPQLMQVSGYDLIQQQQNAYSYAQPSHYVAHQDNDNHMPMGLPEHRCVQQEQDPTTISLLTINSALASSHQAITPIVDQQFLPDYIDTLKSSCSQNSNLCQYHRLVHETGQPPGGTSLLLERQEDEQFNNNDLSMNNLPPPPSSRVIEALENSIHYMTNTSHDQYFAQN